VAAASANNGRLLRRIKDITRVSTESQ